MLGLLSCSDLWQQCPEIHLNVLSSTLPEKVGKGPKLQRVGKKGVSDM